VLRVRPHPADSAELDVPGVALDTATGPAELDPRVHGAAVVLGAATTALLNCAALGVAPGVRLDVPAVRAVERALSRDQQELLDAFLGAPVPLEHLAQRLTDVIRPRR
jgi:hypothetical protein